jgi:hypothetical protein
MWLVCLSLGLETAERKHFHTFRVRFVGEPGAFGGRDASRANGRAGRRLCGDNGPAPPQGRTFVTSATEQTLQDGGPYRRCC